MNRLSSIRFINVIQVRALEENISSFTAFGISEDEKIVETRFGLRHFNLVDEKPTMAGIDARIIENMKERWQLLTQQA